jgi:hypothetical protein
MSFSADRDEVKCQNALFRQAIIAQQDVSRKYIEKKGEKRF